MGAAQVRRGQETIERRAQAAIKSFGKFSREEIQEEHGCQCYPRHTAPHAYPVKREDTICVRMCKSTRAFVGICGCAPEHENTGVVNVPSLPVIDPGAPLRIDSI